MKEKTQALNPTDKQRAGWGHAHQEECLGPAAGSAPSYVRHAECFCFVLFFPVPVRVAPSLQGRKDKWSIGPRGCCRYLCLC